MSAHFDNPDEEAGTAISVFEGSIALRNETGQMDLSWEEVHWLIKTLPQAVEISDKIYMPQGEIKNG